MGGETAPLQATQEGVTPSNQVQTTHNRQPQSLTATSLVLGIHIYVFQSIPLTMALSTITKPDGKRRPRQSVKFAEHEAQVVLEVESCFDYPDDTRQALWHSRSDYHFSKSSARVIAKESERYGYSRHLDGVYKATYDPQVQDSLNIWCLHGHSRRGLERWSNSSHGLERRDDQYRYINGVLRAQSEMKLKDEYCDERLREVGHVLSRKSRLFAQMMGEADNNAARWEFGIVEARMPLSPRQLVKPKNLGLSGGRAAVTSTSLSRSTMPARRATGAATSKISIGTKPGRVPRMA